MSRHGFAVVAFAAAVLCGVAGCLFRATEPPRFYQPASAALDDTAEPTDAVRGVPVRLGSVGSAPFLRERIVWRSSPVEYGLYEQRRWFELPSRYVRRALAATLETTPGLRLTEDASAPRLEVEVLAFDENLAPTHEAHVALAATLHAGGEKRFDRTFAARAPIAAEGQGAETAEAMGRALDEAVKKVASATAAALAPHDATRAKRHRK